MTIASKTQQQIKKTPELGVIIPTAENSDGGFVPVISTTDELYAEASYVKDEMLPLRVRGFGLSGLISAPNGMWDVNGRFNFATGTGAAFTVQSSHATDDVADVGAQKVTVVYLDNALAIKSEEVDMDGVTPVSSVALDFKHPMYSYVSQVGSNRASAGNIVVKSGGTNYDYISAGFNTSTQARVTVPAGFNLRVHEYSYGSGVLAGNVVSLYSNMNPYTQTLNSDLDLFQEIDFEICLASPDVVPTPPFTFPAGATVWIEYLPLSAGTFVSGGFSCQWLKV